MSSGDTVVVTGATGFIGRYVVAELLRQDFNVVTIGRSKQKAKKFSWYNATQFHEMDIYNDDVTKLGEWGDALLHLAWDGLPNYHSTHHTEKNFPENFKFVQRAVEGGIQQVIVAGTCAEYGLQTGRIPSDTHTAPNTQYSLAKDALRKALDIKYRSSETIIQWARLFYVYGDGQMSSSLLPQLELAIQNNEISFNMSGGEQIRDFIPVDEAARQLVKILLSRQARAFNVCSGNPISVRDIVEKRIEELGASIRLNLGYYGYTEYEPMSFWGEPDV